ncbi:MAG: class I SAM-dependent methyltransferase [Bacteroidia bacterium]
MENLERKNHWENIYQTKELKDVSWYQRTPETSLNFIQLANLPRNAKIIDIGGGDSLLVDHLIDLGYLDITVLDISAKSLDKAKQRLGDRASNVHWIVADISNFRPSRKYDLWHDRAAFHFLTDETEIENYVKTVQLCIQPSGILIIGTFSEQGPRKCSGIEIKQYSEMSIYERFMSCFEKIQCITVDHQTPTGSIQNFVFCYLRKFQKT